MKASERFNNKIIEITNNPTNEQFNILEMINKEYSKLVSTPFYEEIEEMDKYKKRNNNVFQRYYMLICTGESYNCYLGDFDDFFNLSLKTRIYRNSLSLIINVPKPFQEVFEKFPKEIEFTKDNFIESLDLYKSFLETSLSQYPKILDYIADELIKGIK